MSIEDILTPPEMQVAALIADGYKYSEIAKMLGKRTQTVKNQSTGIYRKLGLQDDKRRPSILLTRLVMREQME